MARGFCDWGVRRAQRERIAAALDAPLPDSLHIVIGGINLIALRNRTFRVGTALLRGTGVCAPCSRMEQILGPGGYNAMRGHGGITAEVVDPGTVKLGDALTWDNADGRHKGDNLPG